MSFTFSVPRATFAVIVLAQLDSRSFREISGYSQWSLEFLLFRKDDPEPLGFSVHSHFWGRSVNLEMDLEEGEYVVHVRMDRRAIRNKDYFKEGLPHWDWRKLGRVWSAGALSHSVAANFDAEYYRDLLPVPLDKYAGRDLTRLELETHAAIQQKRDTLRAQIASPSTTVAPQDDKPLPQVPFSPRAAATTTTTTTTTSESLMVLADVIDTPIIRAPPIPMVRALAREPGIPEHDEHDDDQLLGPSVFVDRADDTEVGDDDAQSPSSPLKNHLQPPDLSIKVPVDGTGAMPDRAAMDAPATPGGPLQDEPEQDFDGPMPQGLQGPPFPPGVPVHERYVCDGCGMSPIVGIMYVCMHATCPDYDLCSDCVDKGIHPRDHTFMRVDQPTDMEKMQRTSMPGDEDDVVLGLRVYTHRDAPATIAGQLRHGRVVTWTKEKQEQAKV